MVKKKREKIEYKETTVFELFPEYEYTKQQKARLVLFHAYAKNVKKIINYAAHFDVPNLICLIYIVGDVEDSVVQTLLANANCSECVWVLTSPYPADDLKEYNAFDKFRKGKQGLKDWDDEKQDMDAAWYERHEGTKKLLKHMESENESGIGGQVSLNAFDFTPDWALQSAKKEYEEQTEAIEQVKRYRRLVKKAPQYFKTWTLHRRGKEPVAFRHKQLEAYIENLYPCGVEAKQINQYASLSPAALKPAVQMVLSGIPNKRLGDFQLSDTSKPVQIIRRKVRDEIEKNGYISIMDLREVCFSPPLGLANNGYSAAVLVKALMFDERLLYFNSLSDFKFRHSPMGLCDIVLGTSDMPTIESVRRNSVLFLESKTHEHVRKVLCSLYGISHPKEYVGRDVANMCRTTIENMVKLPLSVTDETLFRITDIRLKWHDRQEMEAVAAQVDEKKRLLPKLLKQHIQRDAQIHGKRFLPGSAGWLWDRTIAYDECLWAVTPEEDKLLGELYQESSEPETYQRYRKKLEEVLDLCRSRVGEA